MCPCRNETAVRSSKKDMAAHKIYLAGKNKKGLIIANMQYNSTHLGSRNSNSWEMEVFMCFMCWKSAWNTASAFCGDRAWCKVSTFELCFRSRTRTRSSVVTHLLSIISSSVIEYWMIRSRTIAISLEVVDSSTHHKLLNQRYCGPKSQKGSHR